MVSPSGEGGIQVTLMLVGPVWTAVTSLGGEATGIYISNIVTFSWSFSWYIPGIVMVAESDDGLLFSTVQVYSPPVGTVYCAVSGLSNTVSVPSVTVVVESLVQVTVVAGPPVEIQVRVSWPESNLISPKIRSQNHQCDILNTVWMKR